MKKTLPHIIYIIVIVALVIFARIKANEAGKNAEMAQKSIVVAEQTMQEAEMQEQIAMERAAEAEHARMKAEQLANDLEACKSR